VSIKCPWRGLPPYSPSTCTWAIGDPLARLCTAGSLSFLLLFSVVAGTIIDPTVYDDGVELHPHNPCGCSLFGSKTAVSKYEPPGF